MLKIGHKYPDLPEEYLNLVLKYEGGYVNNPYDRGGETNRGITIGEYCNIRENFYHV